MAIGPGFVPAQLPTGQKYFELPFNELLAGLSAKQGQFDKAVAAGKDIPDLVPEGGLQTSGSIRNSLIADLDAEVNPIMEQLYATGKANPYEFEKIAKKYKADPRMQLLKDDAAMRAAGNKLIAEGQLQYGIQDWYNNGKVRDLQWVGGQAVDPSTGKPVGSIGEAYKYIPAENTQKWLMTKMKDSVIPQVEHNLGIKNLQYKYDENGNVVGFTGIDQKGYKKDYSYDLVKSKLLDNSKGKSLATSMLESIQGDKEGPYYLENYKRKGINVDENILTSDILSSGFGHLFTEDTRDATPIVQGSTGASGIKKTPEDKTPVKLISPRVATNPTVILGKTVNSAFQAEDLTKQSLQNTVETANNIAAKATNDYSKYGVTFTTIQENGKTKIKVNGIDNVQSDADKVAINNFAEAENSKLAVEQNKLKSFKKQEDLLKRKHGLTKDLISEFKEKDPVAFDKSLEELGKELINVDVISSNEPLTALVMNLINNVSLDEKKEALKALESNQLINEVGPLGNKQTSVSEKFKKILEKNSNNSNLKNYLNEYNDVLLNGVTYRNASTIPITAEGTNAETTFYSTFGNLMKDKAKVSEFGYANKYGKLSPTHVEKILELGDEIQNKIKNNVFISVDSNEGGKLVFDVKLDLGDKDKNGNTIFQTIEVPAEGNVDGANLIYQRQAGADEAALMGERENLSKRLEQNNDLYAEYPEIGTSLVLLPVDLNTSTGVLETGTYNFVLPDLPNQVLQPTSLNGFIKFKNMWQIAATPEEKMQVYNTAKNSGFIKAISDPNAYQTIQENFQ